MPTYDYRCSACSQVLEVIHGIDAPGPTTCTECGGDMRKALSTPAIHFKGSGWAKKDAQAASKARANKPSSTSSDSKNSSDSETKSESTETKSEATETKSEATETKSEASKDDSKSTASSGQAATSAKTD